jgi:Bacterial regulatory proteins, tetR family
VGEGDTWPDVVAPGEVADRFWRRRPRLFGARGCTGTTMRDIAAAVGVLPGSLYAHVDGKETLLREIAKRGSISSSPLDMPQSPDPGSLRTVSGS